MGLARKCGQQYDRRIDTGTRDAVDGRTQNSLDCLGAQVLLEDLQLAPSPLIANACVERRDDLGDESRQSQAQKKLRQLAPQLVDATRQNQVEQQVNINAAGRLLFARLGRGRRSLGQLLQVCDRKRQDLAGAVTVIEQALGQAQLGDVVRV